MKAWLSPEGDRIDLNEGLAERSSRLFAAFARGARFLAVPVDSNRLAAEWALACFHSPVTFVPLPAGLPAPALERRLRQLPPGVVFPEQLPPAAGSAGPALRPAAEIWAVIFSSGTTGEPKGVALSGAALEASARAHAEHTGAADVTWLLDLPLYHVGGLSILTRAHFLGAELAFGPTRFSATETARWLRSGHVRGLSVVPTTLERLLREDADFSALRLALLGGAPATAELLHRSLDRGVPVRATYGMTEHASQIATERAVGEGLASLPGVELRIEAGEILVRSPALASGYFRDGSFEPLPLREGFFPTGDLGELLDGRLLVRGRKSDVILSGGMKIHPSAVEAELAKLEVVADVAVLGVPDPEWGELACAAIVENTAGGFDPAAAKAQLLLALEAFQVPKLWVLLPSIPRTPSGKVVRAELRAAVSRAVKPNRS